MNINIFNLNFLPNLFSVVYAGEAMNENHIQFIEIISGRSYLPKVEFSSSIMKMKTKTVSLSFSEIYYNSYKHHNYVFLNDISLNNGDFRLAHSDLIYSNPYSIDFCFRQFKNHCALSTNTVLRSTVITPF